MNAQEVNVIILRTAGTNCDKETGFAFESCGAKVDFVHINRLIRKEVSLHDYHILAIPGGFSYGDDIISGRILANELRFKLGEDIRRFIRDGKLIIGICNGFQVLVRAGILPGPLDKEQGKDFKLQQTATLTYNDSAKFEDRWIHLKVDGRSIWTEGLEKIIYLPVAHGEGKFMAQDESLLKQLQNNQQIVFRYTSEDCRPPKYPENPNGSVDHIAGIADRTGRILGLMPHPERHFLFQQHPSWTRLAKKKSRGLVLGDGAKIFENGVRYVKEKLLNQAAPGKELMVINKG
jgi:phosphoribosylformylglycinamidine synthase subunit PurQ / glutaminase